MAYDVQSVCDILGISATQAQILVEAHTGNIDRAVCAYLDGTTVLGNDHIPTSFDTISLPKDAPAIETATSLTNSTETGVVESGVSSGCCDSAARYNLSDADATPPDVMIVRSDRNAHIRHEVNQSKSALGSTTESLSDSLVQHGEESIYPSLSMDPQDTESDLDDIDGTDTKANTDYTAASDFNSNGIPQKHIPADSGAVCSLLCIKDDRDSMAAAALKTQVCAIASDKRITSGLLPVTTSNKRKRRQASIDDFQRNSGTIARHRPSLAEVANQFRMPQFRVKKGFDTFEVLKGNKMVDISLREFTRHTPTSAVEGLLPQEMAAHLLTLIRDDSQTWKRHTRVVFNRTVESPRVTNLYQLRTPGDENANTPIAHAESHLYDKQPISDLAREKEIQNLLNTAGDIVGQQIDALQRKRRPPETNALPPWKPTLVIINVYRNGQDATGRHSDTLNVLGPRALIGSVSLGAERLFTLDKVSKSDSKNEFAWDESTRTELNKKFAVRLRHNSLLVMWEGCQEAWKHEVPKESCYTSHTISGALRVNLTFRRQDPEYVRKQPICCNTKCTLRTTFKDGPNHGRYFWMCSTCSKTLWDDLIP